MRVIWNPGHAVHAPPLEVEEGAITPPFEVPARFDAIRRALDAAGGFTFKEPPPIAVEELFALHDSDYVSYLREGASPIPSVFPYGPTVRTCSPRTRRGTYCFDTYTPITAGTFEAALGGAAAALHAADLLVAAAERTLYVLTRPPGHHAEHARCGGYSYFNNAALAANRLAKLGPVAVLDLDVHHGNGTQHLFFDRDDVLTVSLHGDPLHLFPYYSGFADEIGTGRGFGFNLNLPLPAASTPREYEPALAAGSERIAKFRPAFLVVPFGADAHESDPIGGMKLPTEYFAEMGRSMRSLGLPTLVVQEGGYNLDSLGASVAAFLDGIRS
ncbi:MAG: histone deacetylase family protein [Gemmataceae bacterium]